MEGQARCADGEEAVTIRRRRRARRCASMRTRAPRRRRLRRLAEHFEAPEGVPYRAAGGQESISSAMRFRVASSGSRPMPPPMLSSIGFAWFVPVRTTVTAGWRTRYLRKYCAHVLASNSPAHSGSGWVPARGKSVLVAAEGGEVIVVLQRTQVWRRSGRRTSRASPPRTAAFLINSSQGMARHRRTILPDAIRRRRSGAIQGNGTREDGGLPSSLMNVAKMP